MVRGLGGGGVLVIAAPRVQLSVSASNELPNNALLHHQLPLQRL